MNKKKLFAQLKKIVPAESFADIEEKIVYQDNDGSYHLFGQYVIQKKKSDFVVTKEHIFGSKTFSELKNAVVWSTLDKLNRVYDSNRVIDLDRLLVSTEAHIQLHQKLCKNAKDLSSYELFLSKLNEDQMRRASIIAELNQYILETKSWQNRKFKQAAK